MELRINPLVVSDLQAIKTFIEEDKIISAQETIMKIYKCFELLKSFPKIGAQLSKRVSFKTDYRYYVSGNYVVLYRINGNYVDIYRVIDRHLDITGILFR